MGEDSLERPVSKVEGQEEQPDLESQINRAHELVANYADLTKEVRETGKTTDPEYEKKREAAREAINELSKTLSEQLGVNVGSIQIQHEEEYRQGRDAVLLDKVAAIAQEAKDAGFESVTGTEDAELSKQAAKLIEDYKKFVEPVVKGEPAPSSDYSARRDAKQGLIEGIAHRLVNRMNIGTRLDEPSIRTLTERTGVDFSSVIRR